MSVSPDVEFEPQSLTCRYELHDPLPNQMHSAQEAGFQVPETIFSFLLGLTLRTRSPVSAWVLRFVEAVADLLMRYFFAVDVAYFVWA